MSLEHQDKKRDLFDNCIRYLEKNITKEYAVEAWKAAVELLGGLKYTKLEHQALNTIFRCYINGQASELPGFEENASCQEAMRKWIIQQLDKAQQLDNCLDRLSAIQSERPDADLD